MNWKIAVVLLAALSLTTMTAESAFAQGGTGREKTPSTTKKPATRTPTRRTTRSSQSSESESQPTESQPSTSYPTTSATPAPTPAPVESPAAPPEPSLSETMNWLGASLTDSSFLYGPMVGSDSLVVERLDYLIAATPQPQTAFSVAGCTLTLSGKDSMSDSTVTVSFADIDPASVEECYAWGGGSCLSLRTGGSRKTITSSKTFSSEPAAQNWGGNRSKAESSMTLLFRKNDGRDRDRAKKAISRAVQLCGGKSDPF